MLARDESCESWLERGTMWYHDTDTLNAALEDEQTQLCESISNDVAKKEK